MAARGVREVRDGVRRGDFGTSSTAKSPVGILKGLIVCVCVCVCVLLSVYVIVCVCVCV